MAKQDKQTGMSDLHKDDALFETLGKQKKAKKRKIIRTVIILVVILAVVLIAGVSILQRKVRQQFASSKEEVTSAVAERGTISTVVSGSGMLMNVDTEVVSVPSGIEITEIRGYRRERRSSGCCGYGNCQNGHVHPSGRNG